jgi:hypothetical protein
MNDEAGNQEQAREAERARRRRLSIAMALALGAMVLAFYAVTVVRIGGNVVKRSI